jgi:hypothetical protein
VRREQLASVPVFRDGPQGDTCQDIPVRLPQGFRLFLAMRAVALEAEGASAPEGPARLPAALMTEDLTLYSHLGLVLGYRSAAW